MPDSAFLSTERQFIGLITAGAGDVMNVEVARYALPGVPRGPEVAQFIEEQYGEIDDLLSQPPDALIVTGAEPIAVELAGEPYWSELVGFVSRAADESHSVLLSCLAAHAALELFDGVKRVMLPTKCTGVFAQSFVARHPLTEGLPEPLVFPHSRLNETPTGTVAGAGYEILVASHESGWTIASRPTRAGELVLIQGHPEYDASTLLREYRRDVERYLLGSRPGLPALPKGCVAPNDEAAITRFHRRVTTESLNPELMAVLPFSQMLERPPWPWRSAAVQFYANWLADVKRRARTTPRGLSA